MKLHPKNNAILITGATKRLGLAFMQHCLERGHHVIVHYRSSREEADAWLGQHTALKKRAHFLQAELADDPAGIIRAAGRLTGGLGGLINNASLFSPGNGADAEHLRRLLTVNTIVPLMLARGFAHVVKKGWIVNITDAHCAAPSARFENYRLSKMLLNEFTLRCARNMAPRIRVNAIAPGAVLPAKGDEGATFKALAKNIPLKKTTSIASLLMALEFLIDNPDVTGQILYVDGGWHLTDTEHSRAR
ncbi:MAG: SDR family NAD(P)-dependent oxidoreductase [Chitinivibrionales bacterium]|nr:SDR family NAD(P)-dependent oxidoreductase [Chitinivibrionales bacterium]